MDEVCGDGEGKAGGGGGGVEEDMEVGECSEEEEEEEEDIDLGSSPITDQSSMMLSLPSPATTPYEGLASPLRVTPGTIPTGKPVTLRRGPGRPRSRGGGTTPAQARPKKPTGLKFKRWKGLLVSGVNSGSKSAGDPDGDESTSPSQPSTPVEPIKAPIFVDEPLFNEQWPGKLCILCNLSEHSQLGQGKMMRFECAIEDLPKDLPKEVLMSPPETPPLDSTSPRQPFQNRRQKGLAKYRNSLGGGQEPVDELSLVGHVDIPEPVNIVDAGFIYIHEWCAVWCSGVIRDSEKSLRNIALGVMSAVGRRCYHCSRFGAGIPCVVSSCNKHFHAPCAAASAAFQHSTTITLICFQHIDQVLTTSSFNNVRCSTCDNLGNVENFVMCSVCGNHHHGACIGNALHPGLRAGWQCSHCRICQLCREKEETSRMLVCDACDKGYHPYCVRPAMSSVPKVGWKCKRCRLCSDCGARTPGGGLSSRWHSNYTVCDSCYQQRNKGFSCPVCHKAYRAAALREMVKCSQCQRFVHGTCDKEADFVSYHRKKEAHPEYQYICLACKNNTTDKMLVYKRKDSTDEINIESNLSISQESLIINDDTDMDSDKLSQSDDIRMPVGLGKGKPFYASKIAKKRFGLGVGPGRPKGSGKMSAITAITPALSHFQKRSRFADFGRKRGAKTKMRGIFGIPGLGLQRPLPDSSTKTDDEPGGENKLVLFSAKDKFVMCQDVCVACGSLGTDQEACLISCAQCGQCFHPFCVPVKVTKVMLQRGWRCLDCTVCEGCGQRNDEGRLILCDDCDISYHIYCMDPPLGTVPSGVWKCKWCAQCTTCGSNSPGVNAIWQNSFSLCGPCGSRTTCPSCAELYSDGDLIIKCIHCDRWLHCSCDTISNEIEAEAVCAQGYTCILCRPNNTPLILPSAPVRVPSPEIPPPGETKPVDYYVDGVCLSETGLQQIRTLSLENGNQPMRRKRPGFKRNHQDADILATIESVVAGDAENGMDVGKDTAYKDGMIWGSRETGPVPSPPDGFTLFTMESGVVILKRKKQRNLQRLGIGGFSAVKMRTRYKDDEEGGGTGFVEEKARRKPRWNKKRCKLAESYPSYLQEAFFGKELLDITKENSQDLENSSDDSDDGRLVGQDKTITLSTDELKVIADVKTKRDNDSEKSHSSSSPKVGIKEEEGSDGEALKDILHIPDNLLNNDLVNTIMNEDNEDIKSENLIPNDSNLPESQPMNDSSTNQKDELSDLLGSHFNIESMVRGTGLPNMDSKDVEEIFKGVLTDESQESQSSGAFPPRGPTPSTPSHPQMSPHQASTPQSVMGRGLSSSLHTNLSSPVTFPSASPYNSEYSNSPQFSPENSSWPGDESSVLNPRTSMKLEADEALGPGATTPSILYANMNHPELRAEYPIWNERHKQIWKVWRDLSPDKKTPYIQQARENRNNRLKKAAQAQEPEKAQPPKTNREAEQEKWKQMQALRQQQLLAQNRAQATTRIHRQISGDGTIVQFSTEPLNAQPHVTQQLQVSTPQELVGSLTGLTSPRAQFTSPAAIKMTRAVTPGTPTGFPRIVGLRPPQTTSTPFAPRQGMPEEMNRQLRDLLQRQHVKQEVTDGNNILSATNTLQGPPQIRQQVVQAPRAAMPPNSLPAVDARTRLLVQQQRGMFTPGQIRMPAATSSAPRHQIEQFNLIQRQQFVAAPDNAVTTGQIVRTTQPIPEQTRIQQPPTLEQRLPATSAREGEEIPDSVTAELEKLEQEGGTIAEADAVEHILGDLAEDDDELLAEMGADFNILEYADPELDNVTGGEKTNILDDLEEEVDKKKQTDASKRGKSEKPVSDKPRSIEKVEGAPLKKTLATTTTSSTSVSSAPVSSASPVTSLPQQIPMQGGQMPLRATNTLTPQFATPSTPMPRMPGAQTIRPQVPVMGNTSNTGFIPPPPYPGPPPPYPGQMQSGIRVGGAQIPRPTLGQTGGVLPPHRRPLLLQEQPLLLEELLEEEKREQEKQAAVPPPQPPPTPSAGPPLMSDADFELLRADILGTTSQVSSPQPVQGVPLFNSPAPPPPLPPENIVTEQDRQAQIQYEQWLHNSNNAVTQQLKYYETEVQKLRKIRKEYQNKQEQKGAVLGNAPSSVGSASPQSPALMSPGVTPQPTLPSPQNSVSPLHHSPRIGTPLSQSGDDKSETGSLASPRAPPMVPTPPSPHQYQIRHASMVPRFARSPEAGIRARMITLQGGGQQVYSTSHAFVTSPQPNLPPGQTIRLQGLTPQQQQLLIKRQQLQQQKQQLLQQQQQQQQEQQENVRQILQTRQVVLQEDGTQQIQMIQRQQLVQQNRQQILINQSGKVGQFRQLIQQNSQNFPQSSPLQVQSPIGQFPSGSPLPPSPLVPQSPSSTMPPQSSMSNVQQFTTSSSPLHPQSPMLSQFHSSSSPMPQQSPRVQNYQTASSPMTPQSPMVYSGLQSTSPMPQFNQPNSPMPPQSPRLQQFSQPPTSPMSTPQSPMLQQQFVHRPNSPMPPRSPMPPMGSPMPMRRPSSTGGSIGSVANSPATERPQSVENPRTPQDMHDGGGGGNPYNPLNPIPLPPGLRNGYFKLGLKGGSPMWNDKPQIRKPIPKGGKVGLPPASTSGGQDNAKHEVNSISKVASLVCSDYNDFDEESRTPPITPPAKPAMIKKSESGTPKTRQSEDTDSELTVYDDIVLVESCKEANLEVEELQSALEGNVMSTVVSMPMVIDPGHILESDLLKEFGPNDLVVLDVGNGSNENDCILEVVEKDDILILNEGMDDSLKVDDSDLMDLEEDMPSPPPGRKRLVGKVLPGQSMTKEDDKLTSDNCESPDEDDPSPASVSPGDVDTSTTTPTSEENRCVVKQIETSLSNKIDQKSISLYQEEKVQPNVVVSRTPVSFTPVITQKTLPLVTDRRLTSEQAAVASLVQDAVNAAKLAAEAQNNQKVNQPDNSIVNNILANSRFGRSSAPSKTTQQFHSNTVGAHKTELSKLDCEQDCLNEEGKSEIVIKRDDLSEKKFLFQQELLTNKSLRLPDGKLIKKEITDRQLSNSFSEQLRSSDLSYEKPNANSVIFRNSKIVGEILEKPLKGNTGEVRALPDKSPIKDEGKNDVIKQKQEENNKELSDKLVINNLANTKIDLPYVSSSILEAQLTSMLRSPDQPPNAKFLYAYVKDNRRQEQPKANETQDDLRVEGLAAHFQRTIKNEDLKILAESKEVKSRSQPTISIKHGNVYVSSQINSDTVMVGDKPYKIYSSGPQTSTSDILNIREGNIITEKTTISSESDANGRSSDIPKAIKFFEKLDTQKANQSILERRIQSDNRPTVSSELQQRTISSSDVTSPCEKDSQFVNFSSAKTVAKEEPKKFVSLSTMLIPRKDSEDKTGGRAPIPRTPEDSQNVLLKQLLQNTACATTTVPNSQSSSSSLPIVPSLEAQLARPVPPTPSSLIPPVLNEPPKPSPPPPPPPPKETPPSTPKPQTPLLNVEPQRITGPSSLDELLSPPPTTQPTTVSQPPPVIKREPLTLTQPPPVMTPTLDIKKEPLPATSPVLVEVKKEVMSSDEMLSPGLKMEPEQPGEAALQDLKKLKRRQYQQKRRQSLGKEAVGGTPKKRPRKSSKVEEDYDSFIDSLMHQLRQTPAMTVCEPNLAYNFTACPVFGSGDLSKVSSSTRTGELKGTYGNATVPNENDHYNTLPFGDLPPQAPTTPSTQRGFYNEEFAPLKLHSTKDEFDDRKYDYNRDRDNDTPDTIVSSSSPECIMPETPHRFPGLQLIDPENDEEKPKLSRHSPDIPIISPLAVRAKPLRFYDDMDKENEGPQGKKHCENVTVTLTLSTQVADDVLSVLRNLANVLRIPVPVNYSVTERSLLPPSHKLGLYKVKSKDGKEGVQIDIQSILNGAAKFCRHCDVVIWNKHCKRSTESPLIAKQGEEEFFFCSSACLTQVSLSHPLTIISDKGTIVLDQNGEVPPKKIKLEKDNDILRTSDIKREKIDLDCDLLPYSRSSKKDKVPEKPSITPKKSPLRFRTWTSTSIPPPSGKHKKPTEKEMAELLFRLGITVMPSKMPDDIRTCLLCHQLGDAVADGPGRLLNYDVNKWIHLNCALWSDDVYETVNGGLVNVETALQNGMSAMCIYCNKNGGTLKCYKMRCSGVYHLPCAVKSQCVFYKNKSMYCNSHVPKNEKDNELTTLSVTRRVYISRDENRQVASIMHHSEQTNLLRVGSLIFLSVGQLLPHQLQAFHTSNYIYPIGYKILRMYWSMRVINKRCKYICSIHEVEGRPEFRIVVQEKGEPDIELKDTSCRGVWLKVLEPLAELRKKDHAVQLFTQYITGEDLFGLTEPAIVRVLESLPGVETLTDYKFKYGRNPLLELPLAINPTGCARSEGKPKGQGHWKRAHTQRTSSVSWRPTFAPSAPLPGELACPYSKQFVHSKSSQYKKMKLEWRNNVYLARSKIQGLGLYAARDLERHTMVIEYIGEIIRTELAETREKQYEAKNRGIYMFRLDEDRVVDATLCGGLARYINHSCSPNCVAETVEVDRDLRIIIFTKRRINRGEELAYDYKFDIEDDQHKIPCMCGAPNCRKWMN